MDDKAKKSADFILGSKAADLWLYTCDACANEKVIPKKYRYTTGTGLMNAAEEICDLIESANLLDLREYPRERLGMQRRALAKCEQFGRKVQRLLESRQYPGVNAHKAATWSRAILTVRYMCAKWYSADETTHPQMGGAVRGGRDHAGENRGELRGLGGPCQAWGHGSAPKADAGEVERSHGPRRTSTGGAAPPSAGARENRKENKTLWDS